MKVKNLLIEEPPLQVLPSLAVAVGLNQAIMLQQLHYWLRHSRHEHKGRRWVYNSYEQWRKQFPFWSVSTIRRVFNELRASGLILVDRFNKRAYDKTNWYTIDYDRLSILNSRSPQSDCSEWTDGCVQNEQTNTRDYTKELPPEADASGEAPLLCPECNRPYKTQGGLTRHLMKKHGIDRVHPAVRAYIDIAGSNPRPGVRQMIIDKVGQAPAAVDRWREVVLAYCACGWNGRNVETMLSDYFVCRRIPKGGNGNGRSNHAVRGNGGARNESDWSKADHGEWADVLGPARGEREGDPIS